MNMGDTVLINKELLKRELQWLQEQTQKYTRKETAEKILNYLYRHLGNGKPSGNVLRDCAKQFGVEIKE